MLIKFVSLGNCNGEKKCVICYFSGTNRLPIANNSRGDANNANGNANTDDNVPANSDTQLTSITDANESPVSLWSKLAGHAVAAYQAVQAVVVNEVIPLTTQSHIMTSYLEDVECGSFALN